MFSLIFLGGLMGGAAAAADRQAVTIQALIDGPSELHVKRGGVYWTNGRNAKPGRHDTAREPAYLNGNVWTLNWGKPRNDRGEDRTGIYGISLGTLDLDFKLLSVGKTRDATGIERRSPIELRHQDDEYIVRIRDPESGPRWYKFVLTPRAPAKKLPGPEATRRALSGLPTIAIAEGRSTCVVIDPAVRLPPHEVPDLSCTRAFQRIAVRR